MKNIIRLKWTAALLIFALCATNSYAGNDGVEGTSDDSFACINGEWVRNACVSFQFTTGPMRNHVKAASGIIGVTSDTPSPTHSTPQALKVVTGLYGIQRVVGKDVDILKKDGSKVTFTFPTNSAVASPADENSTWNASLKKVGADGNLSVTNAVTYDLYTFNGLERIRFSADTNSANYLLMVDFRTDEGQVYQASEFGLSYIYDEEGVIRQVMAPTRLLDFVVIDPYEYEVRFYKPQDVTLGTNGLYAPLSTNVSPFEFWTVENPDGTNAYNRLDISRTVGGTKRTFAFTYDDALHMWTSTEDGGLTLQKTTLEWDVSNINGVRTSAWLAKGEAPVEKWTKRMVNHSWGRAVMEKEDHISATNSQITTYTYYTNAAETGRFRKPASEQRGDGTWDVYDYDSLERKTLQISSWKDVAVTTNAALAKAVAYDYTPHETSDVPLEYDERPRTVTETVEGIITKKTFFTYKTNSIGAQVHITEQCISQSASYGDAANLRTIKTFYPPYEGDNFQDRLNAGRLKTAQSPDGKLTTYEYALGDLTMNYSDPAAASFTASTNGLDWQVTVIHGTTNSPAGIAGKTVKDVPIKDEYNNVVLQQTYIYTGSGYERIQWEVSQFDVYGHALNTWYSDGTQESGYWGTGCCGKDNGTDQQGIKTAYTYDLNKRMMSAAKLTTNDTAGVTKDYTYDASGRRLSTVLSATGIVPLTNSVSYDMLGRELEQIAENGTVTTWNHDVAGLVSTNTLPGGATRITTKYADGKIKSITGTAVVAETYEYGVNSDGTQWIKKYTGPEGTNSPMWEKATTDLLGRAVQAEKPAFGGGTLVAENVYVNNGRLEKTIQSTLTGSTTSTLSTVIYSYDSLGNVIRQGQDVDEDGVLALASMDRITDSPRSYVKENGDWFERRLQIIYPQDNSSSALTNSSSKTRLTGLGSQSAIGNLQSEVLSTDRFGNQTIQKRYVNRADRTVTTMVDAPTSTQDVVQVSINGILVSAQSASSAETLYSYDALERRIGQFQVSGFTSQVSRTVGSFTHYNNKGQIDWQEDAASNRTWFAYDSGTGLKTAVTNALGQTTLYTYNDRGDITVVGGSSQYPVEYGYDAFGRMTDLYTLRGATNGWDRTQWLYDNATGLVTNELYADGVGPSYSYTPDGKLATRTWARLYGSSRLATHYYYDSIGQLTNTVYSDGTPSVSIAYNRLGQKTQVIDASGTNTFAYSDMLQLTNETVQVSGFTSQLSRSYDSLGRSSGISLSDPSSSSYAVQYSYDDVGRFSSVSSSVQSVSSVVDYSYLEGSSFISGYTNNSGLAVSYSFEDNRNLKTSVSSTFGTNTVSSFSYTYDEIGRRTQRIDVRPLDLGLSTNVFAYNSRSELTSAQMSTNEYDYGYDSIGNREFSRESTQGTQKETSYLANNLNQYLSTVLTNLTTSTVSTNLLSYDADGNLLSDGTSTYTWDGENRLIQASNATMIVAFKYDHQGRRFEKTVNATNTTRFVYDDWAMISEISNQNSSITTNSYVYGLDLSQSLQGAGGVGGLLSVVSKAQSLEPKAFFPCYDANGNVTDYVSTNGTVVARYVYDAYGNLISSSGNMVNDFSILFSSKYLDRETGLYYYGYRYYSPELGRWLNRDPIGEDGGRNLYGMSYNALTYLVDSLGAAVSTTGDFAGDFFGALGDELSTYRPRWRDGGIDFRIPGMNWGGRGWGNGGWNPETGEPYPEPGDPDYKKPVNDFDECSEQHDRDINACPKCPVEDNRKCVGNADGKMGDCLSKAGHDVLGWLFGGIIREGHESGIIAP